MIYPFEKHFFNLILNGFLVITVLQFSSPVIVSAQSNASLPIALTVALNGASSQGGQVVVYNEVSRTYSISDSQDNSNVYGVTVERPPLLFLTATNTTAVVTYGTAYVNVSNDVANPIRRGDLLITSPQAGVATRAQADDENVFAIALEDFSDTGNNDRVLAQIDVVGAKALLAERKQIEADEEERVFLGTNQSETEAGELDKGLIRQFIEEYSRAILASVIAIGSLFFIMYTFRTTIVNATLAVGRNPRARNAIMTVSVENIVFALIICLVSIFIAIAVLVLPIE